ncbi:MAG: MASE1 domain-containing protein [Candidatus Riflebacteria bacterium]|nr:MASE1 domain-containing protein [Candidatus Riflebacteria bacterium]
MGEEVFSKESISAHGYFDQSAVRVGIIALAYFFAHYVSFLFPDTEKVLMAIWPAAGVGLAALLLTPRHLWPVILVVLFVSGNSANLLIGRPLFNSLGFMTTNILESLSCALWIKWLCGDDVTFSRIREVLALLVASTIVNACTALIGAETALLAKVAPFWGFWQTWTIADGLGILIIAPLIVSWLRKSEETPSVHSERFLEWILFLMIWCGLSSWVFTPLPVPDIMGPNPYILVAALAWPAFRFGQQGVTVALVLLGGILVTSKGVSIGPLLFGGKDPTERLLAAQIFLGFASSTGFFLAASYSEMKVSEKTALDEHMRLRALGDNLPNGIVYQVVREHDGRMRFVYVSAGVKKFNGVAAEEILRDSSVLYGQIIEEDRARVAMAEETSAKTMTTFNVVTRFRRSDGEIRWFQATSSPRFIRDGRLIWDGILMDITEREEVEQQLKQSLREKETLLKEIHHRVKNNMAIVSSLLALQARRINDPVVKSIFEESQQRVKAMALVHEKIYQTKDLSFINFKNYIKSLISEIISLYQIDANVITAEINIDNIELDLESAIPCGLIINELLTNAFKYAYPGKTGGIVSVCFTRNNDSYTLAIKDNGVGLPENFDYKDTKTLGLQLVNILTGQLNGTLQLKSDKGTEVIITFKPRRNSLGKPSIDA